MGAVDDYIEPRVSDYGSLNELTATVYPLLGAVGSADLTFSAAQAGPPGGGTAGAGSETALLEPTGATGAEPTADGGDATGDGDVRGSEASGDVRGGEASGGGAGPGGAGPGDSGGGGGGNLPFTGFAAGAVALAGSALAVAGRTLRRATSRRF